MNASFGPGASATAGPLASAAQRGSNLTRVGHEPSGLKDRRTLLAYAVGRLSLGTVLALVPLHRSHAGLQGDLFDTSERPRRGPPRMLV